jgi:hypothetical protein
MQKRIFGYKLEEATAEQKCIKFSFAICILQVALLRAIKNKEVAMGGCSNT